MSSKLRPWPLALVTLMLACSAEREAKKIELAQEVFDEYELVFGECEKLIQSAGAQLGSHSCTKVSSMALELSLDETGIDEATREQMIAQWVSRNPLGSFYADADARETIPGF